MKMNNTVKLGAILPALLNPATAVIGVGIGLLWLLSDDDDEETGGHADVPTVGDALLDGTEVAVTTVVEPLPTVEKKPDTAAPKTSETMPDADQKEMIRKTIDLRPKFPPALYGVLGVKSLALGRHLVHRLSLQKLHWRQVPQG
jgi:hypothetical protein